MENPGNIGHQVIRHGFDTLDLAFAGTLSARTLKTFEDAKGMAIEEQAPEPVQMGRVLGLVHPAGVKGAQYRFDTGADRENWFIAADRNPRNWNIRVSIRAQSLAAYGVDESYQRVMETARELGASITDERVSRVDYAIDIKSPDFELDPRRFVIPSGGGLTAYDIGDDGEEHQVDVYYYNHRPNSIRIGKVENRQVAIYDKRREIAVRRHNSWWWDIWDLDPTDPANRVWRVEIRAARGYMRKFGLNDFEDFQLCAGDVFNHAVTRVRYVEEGAARFRDRPNDPIWQVTQDAIRSGLNDQAIGLEPADVVRGEREAVRGMLAKQLTGLAMAHAYCNGLVTWDRFLESAALHYGSAVEDALLRNQKDAKRRFERTAKRYEILYRH